MRLQGVRVDHRSHGVGRVMEAVDKFKAQRDRQRKPKQHELEARGGAKRRKVRQQAAACIHNAAQQRANEDRQGRASRLAGDL